MFDKFIVCGCVCTPAFTSANVTKVFAGPEIEESL